MLEKAESSNQGNFDLIWKRREFGAYRVAQVQRH